MTEKLPLDAKIALINKMVDDLDFYSKSGVCPSEQFYKIQSRDEDLGVERAARVQAFNELNNGMKKVAFDTRRIDQETQRNPRTNLQYWHRSDQFIDGDDESKLKTFAKLARVTNTLKKRLGKEPEWFESYARQLHDHLYRILRVKEADLDIFRPQVSYLEQLLFARYRLSMDDLHKLSEKELSELILKKDESLIGRSNYLKEVQGDEPEPDISKDSFVKNAPSTQESIVNAIFGAPNMRQDGEKKVERTITIKITDNVVD